MRPRFEIVVGTANAAERRLVSVSTIRTLTGVPETGEGAVDDTTLTLLLDAALAQCATSCRLARYGAMPLTLAREAVRATWLLEHWRGWRHAWPSQLFLPWRAPITSIAVVEGEVELVENTDFRLLGSGVVERIGGCWQTSGSIVVDYIAGWVPTSDDPSYEYDTGESMPADIVSLLADQVRMSCDRRDIDLNLRSEDVPGVWSGSYNVAGGDAIDTSGLIRSLYDALSPYRAPPSFG